MILRNIIFFVFKLFEMLNTLEIYAQGEHNHIYLEGD